ncbi:tubulin-like doman-containing protein [Mycobacterium sp. NPDC050441]|uniref:tubulin-like doman-containing protein n=1 Tax=Mycobacterium sp. NPDC050441 TaxID=3155403 RepID=UPI003402A70D
MRRFLVVGCGGSGGATLAFMMDQLRSELHAAGVDKVLSGWQFVHIDVPSAAESGPEGLANVPAQGGSYIGCGPQGSSYAILDGALSQRLAADGALDAIATWAPRNPQEVTNPISAGAGQYRAIGRMITLSKASEIHARLQAAWDALFRVETISEMSTVSVPGMGRFDPNEPPLVLVVSSMAGGAGASMALDICRLLTLVTGLDPKLMGVFMVTPDIFESLPESARIGVRANALAMLGEIVASQTGAAREHDVRILRALGQHHGDGEPIPFARVFPVGRYIGADRTLFGDGSQYAVYRGLARGLAGLMMSGKASDQFVSYDLGNTASPTGDRDVLGWGISSWDVLPWGTYGFSSLSMGRDRYAEYAAQRLARSCADKLSFGHLQAGNPASSNEQLDTLLSSQWQAHCNELRMPAAAGDEQARVGILGNWIANGAFPPDAVTSTVNGLIERQLRGYLPNPQGMSAEQWVPVFRQAVMNRRAELARACSETAYAMVFSWHREFSDQVEQMVGTAAATLGLPYARELIDRLRLHLDSVLAPGIAQLGAMGPPDIVAIPPQVDAALRSLRGVMTNADQVLGIALDGFRSTVRRQLYADAAARMADVLRVMGAELLAPLRDALGEAMILLEKARTEPPSDVGLARLSTDQYVAWPSDADELVPSRFAEANNEVLLISSSAFKQRYENDLPKAVGGSNAMIPLRTAVDDATTRVILGLWQTTGGTAAPGGLIERTATWVTRALGTDPENGRPRVPSMAQFDVHTRPAELLRRARLYVGRPGESFEEFCKVSLRDYVQGAGAAESELANRRRDIDTKFAEALSLARPLASVNDQALQRVHPGQQVEYRYKFSEIPFAGQPVAETLAEVLRANPRIDQATKDNYGRSLSDEDSVTRIDIFGSYPNYSPLVFDSVLKPAAQQWAQTAGPGRGAFWRYRRSRPLAASLPMTDAERRTMTAGWFLGQMLGRIQIPASPFTDPVRIYDGNDNQWLSFPNPLLTPPSAFTASYDWLPAVLESSLLAIATSHEPPVMTSLRPYGVLRALYDSHSQDPASGIVELSAAALVREFLKTGTSGPGISSRVGPIAAAQTPEDRQAAAETWLGNVRDVAAQYLPADTPGATPDGAFTTVTTRSKAAKTPIFRDVAPDVFWATEALIKLLQREGAALAQGETAGAGAFFDDGGSVVIPDGGTF